MPQKIDFALLRLRITAGAPDGIFTVERFRANRYDDNYVRYVHDAFLALGENPNTGSTQGRSVTDYQLNRLIGVPVVRHTDTDVTALLLVRDAHVDRVDAYIRLRSAIVDDMDERIDRQEKVVAAQVAAIPRRRALAGRLRDLKRVPLVDRSVDMTRQRILSAIDEAKPTKTRNMSGYLGLSDFDLGTLEEALGVIDRIIAGETIDAPDPETELGKCLANTHLDLTPYFTVEKKG